MSNSEKLPTNHENNQDTSELESINAEHAESLREALDSAERDHQNKKHESLQDVRNEALDNAKNADPSLGHGDRSPAERRTGFISRQQKDQSFDKQMKAIDDHLSPKEQAFSHFIHKKSVEKISDTAGSTLFRPNALLAGSITAFLLVSIIYLVAKHYGYQLSGFETIGAFALGWVIGIIYDYVRLLAGSNKS